ncbi:ribonuclease Z [Candidatus Palauibacter polyketidifaciens]|uniref:MBL fold metallo-hydrolase n=1 Tax=Candidatus Palauibacter polyketidifaciens TaxID=3056740 RepID=UPI00139C1771|nr:ribonuclease Z [Candidatus Palauibacter polyketidifaciens]MDE2721440.1 ribonuclease Z [Candidatus Palauibacter polyketidifaciens]MYE35001.1 ribonuclease Z [Gemmatimonadales bacterium]
MNEAEPARDAPDGAAADELIVVGCGTVVPEADRAASSYWVSSADPESAARMRVLFDCGPGALQALARLGLPWGKITDLAITHFHADHVGALPGLFFALKHGLAHPRTRPLTVWGPAGTRGFLEKLAGACGDFVLDPGFPVLVEELPPGEVRELSGGPRLEAHKTPHTAESVAWRLDGGAFSFGYTGDTGPSTELGSFMRGVNALVCECSLPDSQATDNHLSPARVAELAAVARPRLLVLTHIYPHLRTGHDVPRLVAEAGYAGATCVAREGLGVSLTNG